MKRAATLTTALLLFSPALAASYTVQPGDTLWRIAQASGTTVDALQAANNLSGSALSVGQVLQLPGSATAPAAPSPAVSASLPGVQVQAPARVKEGDPFVLRLSGENAARARVRFPSELNEDVRRPGEWLSPVQLGGQQVILGRVVLGQSAPVRYEVELGSQSASGQFPVGPLGQPVQNLNMPASIASVLQDPRRAEETAAVEKAYELRGAPVWTEPFTNAIQGGRRSSGFGQPRRERAGAKINYHYGMDYSAPKGTRVQAVNRGRVVLAATYPVRGGLVVIDHGAGLLSMYFHMSKIEVAPGQTVKRGQKVGEVGSTGYSTGPHLHLEMRLRGEAVDPARWVGQQLP
ncbi:peptidoglycan DD-metalloendopeptidase family protein [Deinococcus sp. Marseille-Q6407]|uniref:peptidoglycan DD-metalloendopeptidase family protein n=1 Tax=Deinococcus sp. Marseille-Q6407 TaxID=2969223 RepID=UPI0021C19936|nr:M23 family metallopeptidase [Deinococcus sp. Marseille-Q6407]